MSAFSRACEVYRREHCARPFTEDLCEHVRKGFVIHTPSLVLWFRGVNAQATEAELLRPACSWPREEWTGWMIWLLATDGPCDFRKVRKHFPFSLPTVLYERRNRLIRRTWAEMPFGEPNLKVVHYPYEQTYKPLLGVDFYETRTTFF